MSLREPLEEQVACALGTCGEILSVSVVLCYNQIKNGEVFQVSIGAINDKNNDVVANLALGILSCTKLKGSTFPSKKWALQTDNVMSKV